MSAPDLLRVVSVSGGKDSTATLLLALETNWNDDVRAVFADTGNEHEITLAYVAQLSDYLEAETGRRIETVRADFTDAMAKKREKLRRIAAGTPESEIYGKRQFEHAWTPERAARAAELMQPTGNVFLDLCLLKGGFPSRKRQYCTENLKGEPVDRWLAQFLVECRVEQWHGVRADESAHRATQPDYVWGPRVSIRRPILRWGVERVFEQHRRHGVKPNPLYSLGCARVGCMPCINASKADILNIASRFPEEIEKVREYEFLMTACARSGGYQVATFFHTRDIGGRGIDDAVSWARTSRGGKQYDLVAEAEAEMCSSLYGLCE